MQQQEAQYCLGINVQKRWWLADRATEKMTVCQLMNKIPSPV